MKTVGGNKGGLEVLRFLWTVHFYVKIVQFFPLQFETMNEQCAYSN
jgi:hypothetical protein